MHDARLRATGPAVPRCDFVRVIVLSRLDPSGHYLGPGTKNRETESGYLSRHSRIPAGVRCVIFQLMSRSLAMCVYARTNALAQTYPYTYIHKGKTLKTDLCLQSCQLSEPSRQNRCRHALEPSPPLCPSFLSFSFSLPPSPTLPLSFSLSFLPPDSSPLFQLPFSLFLPHGTLLCVQHRGLFSSGLRSVLLRPCSPRPILPRPVDLAIEKPIAFRASSPGKRTFFIYPRSWLRSPVLELVREER